ncbi:hypothetical protein [Pseudoxanthomonas mexicana]
MQQVPVVRHELVQLLATSIQGVGIGVDVEEAQVKERSSVI